jgi:mono/diheme cytochrome c family protein
MFKTSSRMADGVRRGIRAFPPHAVRRTVSYTIVALATAACTTLDRAVGSVPWFTTMRDQPAVRPFEMRLAAPEGSVPITGVMDSLDIYSPAGLRIVDGMHNPIARDSISVHRGDKIFHTYCAVCHGVQGHGDGTVAGPKGLGYAPDLTLDVTKQRSDGYIFAIIRHGRGVMPRYGDKIRDPNDRWNVVNYVRTLQGATP